MSHTINEFPFFVLGTFNRIMYKIATDRGIVVHFRLKGLNILYK